MRKEQFTKYNKYISIIKNKADIPGGDAIKRRERFGGIDAIRGLALLNMIAYHFLYDIMIVYRYDRLWYTRRSVYIWQQVICWTFIFVSGFVWRWGGKNNLRRGVLLNLCGFLLTAVTVLVMPSEAIWFGILNCTGCAALLSIPLRKVLDRFPALPGFCIAFALFMCFKNVQNGYLAIPGLFRLDCPAWLYHIRVLTPLGFPYPEFRSSDYFPILPWIFLYICGYFVERGFQASENAQHAARISLPLLSWMGRHSLWIYLLHQPFCMLFCIMIFRRLP